MDVVSLFVDKICYQRTKVRIDTTIYQEVIHTRTLT